MTPDEKLKEQLTFLDYIYPRMQQQMDELKHNYDSLYRRMISLEEERKSLNDTINQYKKKIQRIEMFIIEQGLIKLCERNKK